METSSSDLADRFRRRRKEMGKTQKDVAEETGVKYRTVQSFEAGATHPQPANLRALLQWAGLDAAGGEAQSIAEKLGTRRIEADDYPPDVDVFRDLVGAYLMTFDDEERGLLIRAWTRDIVRRRHDFGR